MLKTAQILSFQNLFQEKEDESVKEEEHFLQKETSWLPRWRACFVPQTNEMFSLIGDLRERGHQNKRERRITNTERMERKK